MYAAAVGATGNEHFSNPLVGSLSPKALRHTHVPTTGPFEGLGPKRLAKEEHEDAEPETSGFRTQKSRNPQMP